MIKIKILTERELESIYNQYYKYMRKTAYNVIHDYDASEDIASEVFIKLLESINKGIEIRDVKCWLVSVSRFTACSYLKGYKKAVILPITDFLNILSTEDFTSKVNLSTDMHKLLSALRLRNQLWHDCFVLHSLEKLSTKEIAEKLNITESAVSNNIYKAKKFLQKRCKDNGYYTSTTILLIIVVIYVANSNY